MIDDDGREFGVDIVKSKKIAGSGGLWIYYCFPYYLPRGSVPPYPGFEVLKAWLDINFISAAYKVVTNLDGDDGDYGDTTQSWTTHDRGVPAGWGSEEATYSATLKVTFSDPEEAMLFRLMCS